MFVVLIGMIMTVRAKKHWYWIIGYGITALVGVLLRMAVVGTYGGFDWDGVYGQSMWIRALTFSRVFPEYLRLIILPYPLHMERFVPVVTSLVSPWPWITLGIMMLMLLVGFRLNGTQQRQYWFGILWFGILLLPQSGILIPAPALMTEHWLYGSLPGLGLALDTAWKQWGWKRIEVAGFVVVALWISVALRQSYLWADPIRFYEYTLQYAQTARLHNNLGMHYAESGRVKEAEEQYLKAVALGEYPQIYFNLGNLYTATGRESQAVDQYRKARELQSFR